VIFRLLTGRRNCLVSDKKLRHGFCGFDFRHAKLLKPATISEMFKPPKSPRIPTLLGLRVAGDTITDSITADCVNHGLGGMLCVVLVPEINQSECILERGGASNVIRGFTEKESSRLFCNTTNTFRKPFSDKNGEYIKERIVDTVHFARA